MPASEISSDNKEIQSSSLPWIEKYRPHGLDEIVGNDGVIAKLRSVVASGDMQNLILTGTAGNGKTSTATCLARELLGDRVKDAVLELNASDERGIDVVRGKIKSFAQRKVSLPPKRHKIVILDESDRLELPSRKTKEDIFENKFFFFFFCCFLRFAVSSMTSEAQQALRRTMEMYANTTRFMLLCNTSSKLIEPIQSRCAILRFQQLTPEQMKQKLLRIMDSESITQYTQEGIETILFIAQGGETNKQTKKKKQKKVYRIYSNQCAHKRAQTPAKISAKVLLLGLLVFFFFLLVFYWSQTCGEQSICCRQYILDLVQLLLIMFIVYVTETK